MSGDLSGFKFNKMSKNALFSDNFQQSTYEYQKDIDIY